MPQYGHISVWDRTQKRVRDVQAIIAERVLGKPLPTGAEVHHVDENPKNNRNDNLVICPDHSYHRLLHRRTNALNACGNADWRKCNYCKQWDDPANLRIYTYPKCTVTRHTSCISEAQLGRKRSPRKRSK